MAQNRVLATKMGCFGGPRAENYAEPPKNEKTQTPPKDKKAVSDPWLLLMKKGHFA
jgi:hypothetical protein